MKGPEQRPHASLADMVETVRAMAREIWPLTTPVQFALWLRRGDESLEVRIPFPASGPHECTHSLDFSSIIWFGKPYRGFSPQQAAVLKVLWEAWEADCPEVGGQALLAEVESGGRKMSEVFGDHPIWKDGVLARVGKSAYRLLPPEDA